MPSLGLVSTNLNITVKWLFLDYFNYFKTRLKNSQFSYIFSTMSQSRPTDKQAHDYAHYWVMVENNKTKAFRAAFPESKATSNVLSSKACNFHKIGKVQTVIKNIHDKLAKQTEAEFMIKAGDLKRMLVKAAERGLMDKIDQIGNEVPISLTGAVAAISELNKMDGNHAAQKLAGHDGGAIEFRRIERIIVDPQD